MKKKNKIEREEKKNTFYPINGGRGPGLLRMIRPEVKNWRFDPVKNKLQFRRAGVIG